MTKRNSEILAAWNERQKYLDRLLGLALAVESSRANFSPGEDEWTPTDDRVAFQIGQLHDSLVEAAAALTRADMAHRCAVEEAADAAAAVIDQEAGQ